MPRTGPGMNFYRNRNRCQPNIGATNPGESRQTRKQGMLVIRRMAGGKIRPGNGLVGAAR